jgi:hypothetical protein
VLAAWVATAMLIASPGFLELSCSVMQEIPALAPAVAGLCLLWVVPQAKWRVTEILSGVVFGFALQMKLIGVVYLPIAGLVLWFRSRTKKGLSETTSVWLWPLTKASCAFGASALTSFIALNYITGNSLTLQMQLSWAAHFANTRSFEYGSQAQFPFDWTVLLKNWDTTVPAFLGLCFLLKRIRRNPEVVVPIAWLGLTFAVFEMHKPWWPYYYIHNVLPLCWCAGVGIALVYESVVHPPTLEVRRHGAGGPIKRAAFSQDIGWLKQNWFGLSAGGIFIVCATGWMATRVYLEEEGILKAPKIYTALALKEIERFKPFANFLFSDQPIYSFHADLPMPPHLAVISLKRLWTGEMTNARLVAELEAVKPRLILLGKQTTEVPYQELLNREYRLVYQDSADRLYAHASIVNKPAPPPL